MEPFRNRNYSESVQITLAEDRSNLYVEVGA